MKAFDQYEPEVRGVVERAAAAVHARYVARKNAAGLDACVSRHDGVTNLLADFNNLPAADQEDDIASVEAVLESLRREPMLVVLRLLWPGLSDAALEAALREAFAACDPPPVGLADRCASSAYLAALAGLDAHRATIAANRDKGAARDGGAS